MNTAFPDMAVSIIKIRRWDRLIVIMGIPILVTRRHYIETGSCVTNETVSVFFSIWYFFTWLYPNPGGCLSLQWRHNGRDSVSNYQPHDCSLNRLYRRRWKETSKLCVTGLCAGNSPGTGEFPAQMASSAENVSIWWRHHGITLLLTCACRICFLLYQNRL